MADLTYLMIADTPGTTNQFYTLAKQYFLAAGSTVVEVGLCSPQPAVNGFADVLASPGFRIAADIDADHPH